MPALEGATAVEFTHRAVSGMALLLVGWLIVRVFRTHRPGEPVRKAAAWSGGAIVGEALIGAVIVLFEWVESDASVARAVSVPLHLVNTLLLLAGLTLTAFWIGREAVIVGEDRIRRPIYAFGIGMLLIAGTGAITALADTLFPVETLAEGFAQDIDPMAHFLTELRIFHPVVAIVVGLAAARWALRHGLERGGRAARIVIGVVFVELLVGVVNVWALTPLPVQLIHLALADTLWIAWVWMGAELLTRPSRMPVTAE